MVKKIFILFFCFIFSILSCFAEYRPIPKDLSKQYKAEMERIIDEEYPNAINSIDKYFNDVKNNYNKIIKNGNHCETYLTPEVSIYNVDLYIYDKLMKVTQEKYLKIKYGSIGTDNTLSAEEFLYPYFRDNNVNREKLVKISQYAGKKNEIIEYYQNKINELYSND